MLMRNSLHRILTSGKISAKIGFSLNSNSSKHAISFKEDLDRVDNSCLLSPARYASLLRWCGNVKKLLDGRLIHHHMIENALEQNKLLANLLVQMYGNCEAMEDALELFAKLLERDHFTWNFMITAYARHGYFKNAFELFDQMHREGVEPDKFIFASVLSGCVGKASLITGKQIHALVMEQGIESDVVLGNAIVNMYAKCYNLEDAIAMFRKMRERNEASWNAMISVYGESGQGKVAIRVFNQMQKEGAMPNIVTFVSIISACAGHACLADARRMHARMAGSAYEAIVVGNALVSMYGKCGSLNEARGLFDNLPQRSRVSWNSIITLYVKHDHSRDALRLFEQMQWEGVIPNKITFLAILSVFDSHTALMECKWLHARLMGNDLQFDIAVQSCIVNMYGKCGKLSYAQQMFNLMDEHDVFSWNALIAGYSQQDQGKAALQLFHEMQQEGVVPDKVTYVNVLSGCTSQAAVIEGKRMHARIGGTGVESDVHLGSALVSMYGKCGSLQDAQVMFAEMSEQNSYSWIAMITAYAQHGNGKDAMLCFEQMLWQGVTPNRITFLCMLSACAMQAAVMDGRNMHACIVVNAFESDLTVGNALVTMYGKCGSLEDATKIFNKMPELSMVSWSAIIAAHAQNGQGKDVLLLYDKMQQGGVVPDDVTFVGILSACSHTGLVDEGCHFFGSISQLHAISPTVDHYNCMIDLFTRAGRLDEAEDLIINMPLPPTTVTWLTLLGACRNQLDLERGERVANKVFDLGLWDPTPFITLSNLFVASSRVDDAAYVFNNMRVINTKELQLRNYTSEGKAGSLEFSFTYNSTHPPNDGPSCIVSRIDNPKGDLVCCWHTSSAVVV